MTYSGLQHALDLIKPRTVKAILPEGGLAPVEGIAIAAGLAILAVRADGIKYSNKADGSPVSNADLLADGVIEAGLKGFTPDIPIISEESWTPDKDAAIARNFNYWCIDPLDGTRGFVNGGKNFTVNIGLINGQAPLAGVIFAPAFGLLWTGDGVRAWRRRVAVAKADKQLTAADALKLASKPTPINTRPVPHTKPRVITALGQKRSRALEEWLASVKPGHATSVASSLKFCRLAEGAADLYARIRTTMEWDTAAGQAILESAGGHVWNVLGLPLHYGKPNRQNKTFLAAGNTDEVPLELLRQWLPEATRDNI